MTKEVNHAARKDQGLDGRDRRSRVSIVAGEGLSSRIDQEDWFRAEELLEIALVQMGETQPEMQDDFAAEIWQEGHWEVWEREWVGARWVPDPRHFDKAA